MKPIRTWILIADGSRATVHLNEGPGNGLRAVTSATCAAAQARTQELMSDKPGRVFDSEGRGRHAMAYTSDPRREQKKQFARDLSALLAARVNDYDRLVIVSAPATLGDLRKSMLPEVSKKITAELDQDLTNVPVPELEQHLGKVVNL